MSIGDHFVSDLQIYFGLQLITLLVKKHDFTIQKQEEDPANHKFNLGT